MRQIITFLGTAIRPTTYRLGDAEYTGRVFAEALRQFVQFDRMLVCATAEARQAAWPFLADLHDPRLVCLDIATGHNPAELWQIFETITREVHDGDTLIFDITHGLRSLPFLVFLVVAYLKAARRITIEAIYYGAYELGRPAPIIDLSEFAGLLDWLTATNQFVYTGDARYLAHLLEKEGANRQISTLRRAGEELRVFSLAMMLCRPLEIMEKASPLDNQLRRAEADLQQWVRPFGLLADRIRAEYAARALPQPTAPENVTTNLRQQLALVGWYLQNNQIIQAVTLAREWVISAVGWRLGRGLVLPFKERETVERGLGGITRVGREENGIIFSIADLNAEGQILWSWPEHDLLRDLWNLLTSVRNELDHAGMNPNPMKAAKLAHKTRQEIQPRLQDLARAWDLAPQFPALEAAADHRPPTED